MERVPRYIIRGKKQDTDSVQYMEFYHCREVCVWLSVRKLSAEGFVNQKNVPPCVGRENWMNGRLRWEGDFH